MNTDHGEKSEKIRVPRTYHLLLLCKLEFGL
jgi:hypothetical protein